MATRTVYAGRRALFDNVGLLDFVNRVFGVLLVAQAILVLFNESAASRITNRLAGFTFYAGSGGGCRLSASIGIERADRAPCGARVVLAKKLDRHRNWRQNEHEFARIPRA